MEVMEIQKIPYILVGTYLHFCWFHVGLGGKCPWTETHWDREAGQSPSLPQLDVGLNLRVLKLQMQAVHDMFTIVCQCLPLIIHFSPCFCVFKFRPMEPWYSYGSSMLYWCIFPSFPEVRGTISRWQGIWLPGKFPQRANSRNIIVEGCTPNSDEFPIFLGECFRTPHVTP